MDTSRRDVGHLLALTAGAAAFPLAALPFLDGDPEAGPPLPVTLLTVFAGVAIVAGARASWRSDNRVGARVAAAFLLFNAFTSIGPALFIDSVEPWTRIALCAYVVLAVAAVVLMFTRVRRPEYAAR